MISLIKIVVRILSENWKKVWQMIVGNSYYRKDKKAYINIYNSTNRKDSFSFNKRFEAPQVFEKHSDACSLTSYFWQDLWASRKIFENNPKEHYDIGSRIDGFIAHLASFRDNVFLIDIRPLPIDIPGVHFRQADATTLDGIEDNSIESISALCSLEHFGLGRYGDPIDPDASSKAMKSIVT